MVKVDVNNPFIGGNGVSVDYSTYSIGLRIDVPLSFDGSGNLELLYDSTLALNGSSLGINLSNPNTWGALQTFGNNISFGGAPLNASGLATDDILQYNGTDWVNVLPTDLGLVNSVSNSDGTLTISPTTGAVVASLNLANANTWTGEQTFNGGINFTNASLTKPIDFTALSSGAPYYDIYSNLHFPGASGTANWNINDTNSVSVFRAYVGGTKEVVTANNTLDDGSAGNMSIAGNISAKHDYDTTDYAPQHTATDWIGTATLGAGNILSINTGKTTLVFYNYYGGAAPSAQGTVHWNHGSNDSGMALVESGAAFDSTANCTYFWIAL